MENFDLGPGFVLLILLLALLVLGIRTILALFVVNYLVQRMIPFIAHLLGWQEEPALHSRSYFISYEISLFFLAPVVCGLLQLVTERLLSFSLSYAYYADVFPYYYFYFLSLCCWKYNATLTHFIHYPFRRMLVRSLLFLLLACLLYVVRGWITRRPVYRDSIDHVFAYFTSLLMPLIFGTLTLCFIRKNQLPEDTVKEQE